MSSGTALAALKAVWYVVLWLAVPWFALLCNFLEKALDKTAL